MKPKEFDDLVRKKFDRNDFEYKPQNWDRLEEQLEGRAKKRSIIMWWWVPLTGMAASLLMAMGITSMLHQQATEGIPVNTETAQSLAYTNIAPHTAVTEKNIAWSDLHKRSAKAAQAHATKSQKDNTGDWFNIHLQNALAIVAAPHKSFDLLINAQPDKKKTIAANEPHPTFKPEAEIKKEPKISIILSGGVNHGNISSGYIATATVRRMVNNLVYVEGDLGYANSTNSQSTDISIPSSRMINPQSTARNTGSSAKTTAVQSDNTPKYTTTYNPKEVNVSYTSNYVQITPSIGIKVIKRIYVAAGPDFQQMIGDNRPAASPLDRNSIQEAPVFDVGLIGKTEFTLTKQIKAGVYYRKGINDLITPSDKYINRDYLQFQLKWVIFNK